MESPYKDSWPDVCVCVCVCVCVEPVTTSDLYIFLCEYGISV